MRRLIAGLLITATLSGCAIFGRSFQDDPWRTVESVISGVETAVSIGKIIFDKLLPFIAPEQREAVQEKFDSAVLIIKNAEIVARSTVSIAAGTNEKPDIGKTVADLVVAVNALQDVIDQIRVLASSVPEKRAKISDPAYEAFNRQVILVRAQVQERP